MKRRRFLALTATGTAALSGCGGIFGGSPVPPPRESEVFDDISVTEESIVVSLVDTPWFQSTKNFDDGGTQESRSLHGNGIVGVASAKGGGGAGSKGATLRGDVGLTSNPPRSNCPGSYKYYGGAHYDDWEDEHGESVSECDAVISAVGIARIGNESDDEDDLPGPGKPLGGWDQTVDDPSGRVSYNVGRSGWYRIGTKIRPKQSNGTLDKQWEAVDMLVERNGGGYENEEMWKVSPRL